MSANIYSSIEELTDALLGCDDPCIRIGRRTSDDVSASFLAKANLLTEQGDSALIVCVDSTAKQRYLSLCQDFPSVDWSSIVTMRELALGLFDDEAVCEAAGRKGYVLDENDYDVLVEDMKVSGMKPRRLKEMLRFFFKSMSDCMDEQEFWLINTEEQNAFSLLQENLEVRRAMLPCELASIAYRALVAIEAPIEARTILIDDYDTLSKASQRLVDYLSHGRLIIAGSATGAKNADEPYPFHEGFATFADAHPEAACLELSADSARPAKRSVACFDPSAEFDFVAAEAGKLVNDEGLAPGSITIAVPNSTWKRNVGTALKAQGIPYTFDADSTKIKGDPRNPDKCADLKLAAFLRLYLDPHDLVALRAWLGFGDWLMRSDAFLELMAYASERQIGIEEAIGQLRAKSEDERTTVAFSKFDGPLDELEAMKEACEGIGIEAAIALFADHGMPLHPGMTELLGDNPAQADLKRLAEQAFAAPAASDADAAGVHVVPYRLCHGRFSDVLFITGMINGFLPAVDAVDDDSQTIDHRKKAMERERTLFEDMAASATKELVLTTFKQDRLENIEIMKMQAGRIFIKDSVRFATVTPSEFIPQPQL